jgi:single-strand selective monofunctional uracil DNA glycosylase
MISKLDQITAELARELERLQFGSPVSHVYNPLEYAREPYRQYLRRYGGRPKEVVLLGMNPGPWGMAQTGIPFGEIDAVRGWLGIEAPVGRPDTLHPKRPVLGFACRRSEVSGRRLWGWAQSTFATPQRFFKRFFVANYCPLMFMEKAGGNRTPDKLKRSEAQPLFCACDRALRRTVDFLKPAYVVGVGRFAADRALAALESEAVRIGVITHPSPANPKANRGWDSIITHELEEMGIVL